MSWAKEVAAIAPELEQIAGRPVQLQPFNWDYSIGCRVDGEQAAMRIDSVRYKDPKDGKWYALDGNVGQYMTPEQFEAAEFDRTSVSDAQNALRDYVRQLSGKLH